MHTRTIPLGTILANHQKRMDTRHNTIPSLPHPPTTHFLSQPYNTAFHHHNHHPSSSLTQPSIIHTSTRTVSTNISALLATQAHLTGEVARLEAVVQRPHSPTTPRKGSLGRKSLPPTPSLTPSPTTARASHGLRFSRSSSRLDKRSESVSPARSLAAEHRMSPRAREMG